MGRGDLRRASFAHVVALRAIAAPETGVVPLSDAVRLKATFGADVSDIGAAVKAFAGAVTVGRHDLVAVAEAGRVLRDAVLAALAFVPRDAGRVDIHG